MFWVSLSSAPLGSRSPPHPSRLRRATFPPRRRLWAEDPTTFSSRYQPPPPSPPSRGAGRYGRGMQGRRPVSEHRKNLPLATNQREVGPGRREPLSALVFFPPAFFQRKPGSRPEPGGKPRRRAHPAPVQKAPQTGAPPGAGRATTWQVWTCDGPSLDHLPIQRSPG